MAAVDIGASKITVSIAAETGFLIKVYQPTCLEGEPDEVPRQVDTLIRYCCKKTGMEKEQLESIGISSAGPFVKDDDGDITLVSPNMCGGLATDRGLLPNDWQSIPLEAVLSVEYKNIHIGNDAVTGAMAERNFGAARGEDDFVYVTWSTGIGTGAFVDGRPIYGKNGNAPHGSHITLVEDGPQCGCGGFGHLEALASGTAIARDFGDDAAKCFDAYRRSDQKAKEVVEKAAGHFARGLASLIAVLDTRMFILGGSVFFSNIEILLPLIRYDFKHCCWNVFSKDVSIVPSELKDHLPDMAALALVMPKDWIEDWRDRKPWENAPETEVLD
jgi:glucokinase